MTHPLVDQLRFTRTEWLRGLEGVTEQDAVKHFGRMNCISWTVGHMAWMENLYWIQRVQGKALHPELNTVYAMGAPMSSPALKEAISLWHDVTTSSELYLDTLTVEKLQETFGSSISGKPRMVGSALQRSIYHYWYHTGEVQAIRQMLGQADLPQFVGPGIDAEAQYRPEE